VREASESTDGDLLRRFHHDRDEAAFATLMERHGPLVLGVCRRILNDPNDADDAFQGTFLVLARKAGSVAQPDRLASWLYGVAVRVARKARGAAARRRACQQQVTDMPDVESSHETDWNELRRVLDDEVQRLPEKFRLPILLCYLEGRTREEAARQLGWSAGAVKGMLERGRELLRSRLTRRGVTLSATTLAGFLSQNTLSAAVPAALSDSTIKAALLFAAGTGAAAGNVAALAEGVIQAMWISRTRSAVAVILVLFVLGTGVGVLALGGPRSAPEASKKEGPAAKTGEKAAARSKRAAARLNLAKSAYQIAWVRFRFGREPEQTVNLWSRRWLQAQLDLSDKKAARDAALRAHWDRLKKVDEVARARLDLGNDERPVLKFKDKPDVDVDERKSIEIKLKEEFEGVWKAFRSEKAKTEEVCHASVRWLMGLQLLRRWNKQKPQADPKDLQAHLERVKKVEASTKVLVEAGRRLQLDADTAAYYRLQAEEWLAEGKTFEDVLDSGKGGKD
jgi:RNA polymerase sigma factor (sigma-70 family)